MPAIQSRTSNTAVVNDSIPLPKAFPAIPDEVKQRFPVMEDWDGQAKKWYASLFTAVTEFNRDGVTIINQNYAEAKNLRVSVNGLTAEIEEINEVIVTNNEAFARRLVTVSAMAGLATNITVQGTPPGGPALNDYWLDNSDPLTPITYQWDGADWVEVTTPITAAAVAQEATARATADGFLEGKYSLTVIAGDVVTGMNITSATGPGTNISSVIFRATDFKIYNSVSGVQMFSVTGTAVKLGDVFTVDTVNSKIFIGVGNFDNTDTAFFVDDTGRMSLKDQFVWDGTLLSISGEVLSGGLDVGLGGNIRGGQTAYDTGSGFWMGYDMVNGDHRFSVGDGGTSYIRFDGTNVEMSGVLIADFLTVSTGGTQFVTLNTSGGVAYVDVFDTGIGTSTLRPASLEINTTQVVGPQLAAVADATGAGDVVAQLNTLLARIRTHGLIDT